LYQYNQNKKKHREVIGLIPAGGKASRIAPIPCSKELYPIGFRTVDENKSVSPKVVSHYLLEKMRVANITKAFIILREGKWDIPTYFRDGKVLDMHLAYLMMDLPFGVPYTLDQAYPFVKDNLVALGFPDIIFRPDDAYMKLLSKQEESGADIVLGLFPADRPHKNDMIEVDENGRILSIHIKPEQTQLYYAWEIAVWSPVFTGFMHDYVLSRQEKPNKNKLDIFKEQKELSVGDVIKAAIKEKVHIESVLFPDYRCLDIGTPEDLVKAVRTAHKVTGYIQGDL
jgi:glucose-1-phosphate thymidylyltransferase